MIRAIGIGDNVCDKYRHLGMMFPGGQALNFSVYCSMKGNEAAYIGAFGDDEVAHHVIATLEEFKIDISHSRHYRGENGYAIIDLKDGERTFVTSNKGGMLRTHPLEFNKDDLSYIESYEIIHTSNNSYIDAQLPKLGILDNWLSYDFSGSWKDMERTCYICRYIDFGFLSCSELSDDQIKEQLARMHGWGCSIVISTMGSRGAIAYDGQEYYHFKPEILAAVDTLGAGDSLAAGFLMNFVEHQKDNTLHKGSPEYQALIWASLKAGAALSAKTCMTLGAFGHGTKLV